MNRVDSWEFGTRCELKWARFLGSLGRMVVPTYAASEALNGTKAPMLIWRDGLLVSPDLLVLGEHAAWHEVKGKAKPSWYRKRRRWEHGIDYALVSEYGKVQEISGLPCWLALYEEESPADPYSDGGLAPGGYWLVLSLDDAREMGEHRPLWPGGRNSKDRGKWGEGGLLWPRNNMRVVWTEER